MPRLARRTLAGSAALALALGGVLVVASPAAAADHLVTKIVDDGTDGTLRYEVENSAPGDTILFDPAVFSTPQVINLTTSSNAIEIPHDLTVVGPGSELLTLQRADAAFALALFQIIPGVGQTDIDVTISGMTWDDTVGGVGATPLGSAFVATSSVDAGDLAFSDLVVRDQGSELGNGGGVLIEHADAVSFTDVEFSNNDADLDGGAVHIRDFVSLSLDTVTFSGNSAGGSGGAIFAFDGSGAITMTDVAFSDNSAMTEDGGHAALIAVGDVAISDSSFEDGAAMTNGGALYIAETGVLTLSGSTFMGNEAGAGGAVALDDLGTGASTISDSSFLFNEARLGGALSLDLSSAENLTISEVLFQENALQPNDGEGYGAAVYVPELDADSVLVVRNSTFTGQTAAGDADAYGLSIGTLEVYGELTVINSTLDEHDGDANDAFALYLAGVDGAAAVRVAHSTISSGSGAIGAGTLDGTLEISHTILQDSSALEVVDRGSGGATGPITAEWSILSEAAPDVTLLAGNQVGVDPQLGALQSNGGPTPTRLPATSSPAVNQGDPAVAGAPATDQRGTGFARVVQTIDIGAVEHQAELLPATGSVLPPWAALIALLLAGTGVVAVRGARMRIAR